MFIFKKFSFLIFFIPIYIFSLQYYAEFKPGYFVFEENKLNKMFDNGGTTFQLEGGILYKNIAGSLNFQYFSHEGYGINSNYETKIYIPTISIFLKGFVPVKNNIKPYFGIAPRLFFMKNINKSPYVPHSNFKTALGIAITTGAFFDFKIRKLTLFADPFLDYGYARTSEGKKGNSSKQYHANLGGLTIGIGIGHKF